MSQATQKATQKTKEQTPWKGHNVVVQRPGNMQGKPPQDAPRNAPRTQCEPSLSMGLQPHHTATPPPPAKTCFTQPALPLHKTTKSPQISAWTQRVTHPVEKRP